MHAIVLVKRVLDPEIPRTAFSVDPERRQPHVPRAPYVLSVFDGNALEVALRLREARGGDLRITALTLGPGPAEEVLRKALALTVDAAVHVLGDDEELGAVAKADALAAAIRRLPPPDLVLCGRQAADWEAGQIGGMLAEALGLPCVPFVSAVLDPAGTEVLQQLESGQAVYRLRGPTVLTVTNDGQNVLRAAKIKDVMAARGKGIAVTPLGELLAEAGSQAAQEVETLALRLPAPRRRAEICEGETAGARAGLLMRRLRELGAV